MIQKTTYHFNMQIDSNKVLELIMANTAMSTITEYRAELMFKVNSLVEAELSQMFDTLAKEEGWLGDKKVLKTVIPREDKCITEFDVEEMEDSTSPPPDKRGTNKVFRK